ncbi:ketosynthase chain-length factor [Nocardia arthritidis]|uniref:Ketosynthase chain-length factor n=1 Tax=Nocardia arthritidis TaxID=228602 RepID=A0A6G9YDH7_9NOCA|nr:ketosynthase chain-length factor [Nocardia arthritidis]QIS11281.1 ketosynthase chain-length factor [Nocardia arthritidis]
MRAVVTGLGIMAPNGMGAEKYWAATLDGEMGIRRIRRFQPDRYPARLAGEVIDFVAEEHISGRLLPQTDHMTRLALGAADWALGDAEIDVREGDGFDVGVVTASSAGGFEFGQRELQNLWSKGGSYVSAYQSFAWFYAVNTGQISIRHGLRGPSGVLVADDAGGLAAVAQGRRLVGRGTPVVVCGGVDGVICPWGWAGHLASGRLSVSDDPCAAYLPFDARASGYVPGEGGAILVVEDADHARQRCAARCYGEIAGYGTTFDPDTGDPCGLRRAIESALAAADSEPSDIDVVFADAAASVPLDTAEALALAAVFGPGGVPVTAPKTLIGRLGAGGAALDLATALLSLRDNVVPPTRNVAPAAEYDIDLVVGAARPMPLNAALILARGHGGFNSAMVVRRSTQ